MVEHRHQLDADFGSRSQPAGQLGSDPAAFTSHGLVGTICFVIVPAVEHSPVADPPAVSFDLGSCRPGVAAIY